ncbi:MAG: tape measure protein [Dehalococcoidia bacterium]
MVTAGEIELILSARDESSKVLAGLKSQLSGLSRDVNSAGTAMKSATSSGSGFGGMLKSVASQAVGFGAATVGVKAIGTAFGGVKSALFDFNAGMEQAEIGFTTLLGSGEAAKSFLGDLQSFAKSTPFAFPELVQASQKMLAMGTSADQVIPRLTAIGDAAAALGGGAEVIDGVTTALGQMGAKGKVSAEEMGQLTERGIPAWEFLAKAIGTDIPTAMQMAEQGAISADTAISAITEGMSERFGGMMEAQSKTFSGAMSNIKDSVNQAMGEAFQPLFALIASGAVTFAAFLNSEQFATWSSAVSAAVSGVITVLTTVFGVLAGHPEIIAGVAAAIMAVMVPALVAWTTATYAQVAAQTAAAAAFIIANAPLIAIGVAIGLVVAGIVLLIKNWDDITAKVPILGTAFDAVKGVVTAALDAIVMAAGAVVERLQAAWGPLSTALGAAWDGIKAGAEAAWPAIQTVIETAITVIQGYITAYQAIAEAVWPAIQAAAEVAWSAIQVAVQIAVTVIQGYVEAYSAVAQAVWPLIQTAATTAWSAIQTAVSTAIGVIQTAITTFQTIAEAVWPPIQTAAETAFNAAKTVAETAMRAISTAFGWVKTAVDTVFTGAMTAVGTAISTAKGIADGLVSALQSIANLLSRPFRLNIDFPEPPGWLDNLLPGSPPPLAVGIAMVNEELGRGVQAWQDWGKAAGAAAQTAVKGVAAAQGAPMSFAGIPSNELTRAQRALGPGKNADTGAPPQGFQVPGGLGNEIAYALIYGPATPQLAAALDTYLKGITGANPAYASFLSDTFGPLMGGESGNVLGGTSGAQMGGEGRLSQLYARAQSMGLGAEATAIMTRYSAGMISLGTAIAQMQALISSGGKAKTFAAGIGGAAETLRGGGGYSPNLPGGGMNSGGIDYDRLAGAVARAVREEFDHSPPRAFVTQSDISAASRQGLTDYLTGRR